MKGLDKYIEKHGRHFTVELAERLYGNWSADRVYNYLQKKIYYNVSGSTLGDMTYIFNAFMNDCKYHGERGISTINYCRDMVIMYVSSVFNSDCIAFRCWLIDMDGKDFDLTPYI